MDRKKGDFETDRLFCTIPKPLMNELKRLRLLKNIDNLVAQAMWDVVDKEIERRKREDDESY